MTGPVAVITGTGDLLGVNDAVLVAEDMQYLDEPQKIAVLIGREDVGVGLADHGLP